MSDAPQLKSFIWTPLIITTTFVFYQLQHIHRVQWQDLHIIFWALPNLD
jgi:hypothetical protein